MDKHISKIVFFSCLVTALVFAIAGPVKAGIPRTARSIPKVSSLSSSAARGRVPARVNKNFRTTQQSVSRPTGSPEVRVRPGETSPVVEQRADVASLTKRIRTREGASQQSVMRVMTRENASSSVAMRPMSGTVKPGRVRVEGTRIRIEAESKVVYEVRLDVAPHELAPTTAEVERALAELPELFVGETVPPSAVRYQNGQFWVMTEGTDLMMLLGPTSSREVATQRQFAAHHDGVSGRI